MKKELKRYLGIFIPMVLLLSMVFPQMASAYTVLGDQNNPSLTIYKYAQEPGATSTPGTGLPGETPVGDPLEGVEFTLTQTHAFDPSTNEWTEVTGVTPIVAVTDPNGQIVLTNTEGLQLGRYEVQETDGPDSVILNTDVYSVDVPMTSQDGTTLNYDVNIYPKNEVVRGDAELIKVGEGGEILPGVVFGLYNAEDELLDELTTDAEGKITVENLASGTYYFQELQTVPGYTLNNTKIFFDVTQNEEGSTVEWTNSAINDGNVVTNYNVPEIEKDVEGTDFFAVDRDAEYTYNLTITTPGDIQNYSAIGVRDVLDPRLEYAGTWTVTGTDASNIAFNQDGQTLTWEVVDLSQLTANQQITISFTSTIRPDAVLLPEETGIPNTATIHFDNDSGSFTEPTDPNEPTDPENPPTVEEPPTTPPVYVDPTEGALQILKVDKSDNSIVLEGAEFKLTTDQVGDNIVDAAGTIITVNGAPFTGLLENLVTDASGQISIEGLTPGTYYLHETKAPTYTEDGEEKPYRLLTAPLEVTVTDGVDENEVTVENSKSGWELPTTGGMGGLLFTLIGLALMAIAAFALFRRKEQPEVQ
ncbi:SpaH/EbpB family LPXTG-anchored major pilin [Jeotgalibacillus haloalkalitolerans]|uniref:SpaH/EbpB family LPXTG-anchored major pilin n=1 Tax=Jeotgalibacillus haloalkalitolerans TaxID=3104292 RepID=A0ABU5KKU7_9BACL|nr:SpaH/EbpB family LPXTG-anchored major pilin [Jeotgalibacillus sp. HH7-29]MDZ5711361.1 SpaH/EbpB family LPXTG-anchored major pilin [Jeotgalibacillus sp. HH7-29]